MAKVLLLDDEMTLVQMVGELLRSEGHQVVPFTNAAAAAENLSRIAPELVIASLGAEPARSPLWSVVQQARSLTPPTLVMLLTAGAAMDTALEAMKRGAYDCLPKPFKIDELRLRVQRALSYQAALAENLSLRKQLQPECRFQQIITRSPRMQSLLRLIEPVVDSDSPLLIQGPPGSGRHLLARSIHLNSRRHLAPLVNVACDALSESDLEAELFGVRKPVFHGPLEDQPGILRKAEGGTLFLDRIGFLSLPLQLRLLELLQKGRIQTAGDSAPVRVDVRLLAGSDSPLEPKLANGTFSREFYACLNTTPIVLPPLRERPEDIPLLVSHFLEGRIAARNGKPYAMSAEALEIFSAYPWPGNVAELERALQHACLTCQENIIQPSDLPRAMHQPVPVVSPAHSGEHRNGHGQAAASCLKPSRASASSSTWPGLPAPERSPSELVPLKKFLRDQEVHYLHHTLAQVGGSKERAAELLGISLATIYRKLAEPSDTAQAL